jgi:hypothetical protein
MKVLSDFTADSLISTLSISNGVNSDQFRITKYDTDYYLNGYAKVIKPDIALYDCYINFINNPLVIPYPTDYVPDCSGNCYKLSTINESITTDDGLSKFRQLIENVPFEIPPPLTVIALANEAFDSNPKLFDYLLYNRTTLDEFLRLHIIQGTYYPAAGSFAGAKMTNMGGLDISISPFTDGLVFNAGGTNVPSIGVAHARVDGVYYKLTQLLYSDFEVDDTPVAPVPVYTPSPPAALPFDPNARGASFVNSVTLAFLIISCLLVFIIQ